jgi:hypothetical protein
MKNGKVEKWRPNTRKNQLSSKKKSNFNVSLESLYSTVTFLLGFFISNFDRLDYSLVVGALVA